MNDSGGKGRSDPKRKREKGRGVRRIIKNGECGRVRSMGTRKGKGGTWAREKEFKTGGERFSSSSRYRGEDTGKWRGPMRRWKGDKLFISEKKGERARGNRCQKTMEKRQIL